MFLSVGVKEKKPLQITANHQIIKFKDKLDSFAHSKIILTFYSKIFMKSKRQNNNRTIKNYFKIHTNITFTTEQTLNQKIYLKHQT